MLALTPGEPAGIGPDLVIQLAQTDPLDDVVVIADPQLLKDRASELGLAFNAQIFEAERPQRGLSVLPVTVRTSVKPGQLQPANAAYVIETLQVAAEGCLSGLFDAVVTGPVHKGVINEGGIPFTGHTEFFAHFCGTGHPVMMLAIPGLRVALVTTHLPLREVADQITRDRLERVMTVLQTDLRQRFGIAEPHLLVCGLNPHAGEGGHLGSEEIDTIIPVLETLRARGMRLTGPVPADTAFTQQHLQQADVVLTMYHDQGLPVLKYAGFGQAVNITLGLPIIRTSVDHGTALDLAGTGRADVGSLRYALACAREMLQGRVA